MGISFSSDGPEFPDALLEDIARGEVVFLCGAGVSAPQLPGFRDLVERVFEDRVESRTSGEDLAFNAGRYEEVLGSLSRRIVDEAAVYNAVAGILKIPPNAKLAHHKTLLRLSRRLDNRPTLVTTNFDTMFERAVRQLQDKAFAASISVAGQSLPAPGASDFAGIIHLHGRLEDANLGLRRTPLVLTSAEYGEAYMRSGWAARFLFDLTRCRTVVLVGYSASDAPVRYFLNILEADRDRFTDLRPVYALAPLDTVDRNAGLAPWETIGVTVLPYSKRDPSGKGGEHAALWDDLGKLANDVEKPKAARLAALASILNRSFPDLEDGDKARMAWAVRGRTDWYDKLERTADPATLDHLAKSELIAKDHLPSLLAAWCASHWAEKAALESAAQWMTAYGEKFASTLRLQFVKAPFLALPALFQKAWRLVTMLTKVADHSSDGFALKVMFDQGLVGESERIRAVDVIAPSLTVNAIGRLYSSEDSGLNPTRLSSLLSFTMEVEDEGALADLIPSVVLHGGPRMMALATERLRSCIEIANEAELLEGGYDRLDAAVPSVEDHQQNQFHNGPLPLVRLLRDSFAELVKSDRLQARYWALDWREMPSMLATRLYLHALRNPAAFGPDEVVQAVLDLPHEAFWATGRRELPHAIADRAAGASTVLLNQLVQRILDEAPTLYPDDDLIDDGQTDWRPYAREQTAWVRLKALERAKVLNPTGIQALSALEAKHEHLGRDLSERDLFSFYSGGVTRLAGDPALLIDADPAERLEVAHELIETPDFNGREHSWAAFCQADPQGALEALLLGDPVKDVALWSPLLNDLTRTAVDPDRAELTKALLSRAFKALEPISDDFVRASTYSLVQAFDTGTREGAEFSLTWWDRLWSVVEGNARPEDASFDTGMDAVFGSVAARLASLLIWELDRRRKDKRRPTRDQLRRLEAVMDSRSAAGHQARTALVHDFGFIWSFGEKRARTKLVPWLSGSSREAIQLRAILASRARVQAKALRTVKQLVLQAVAESTGRDFEAVNLASKIIFPVVSRCRNPGGYPEVFSFREVKSALASAQHHVRLGAASALKNLYGQLSEPPEVVWRSTIAQIFVQIWPSEKALRDDSVSRQLATLCVGAGDAFPEALQVIKPYLKRTDGGWPSIHFLSSTNLAERYPAEVLDLLWTMHGPPSKSTPHLLGEQLDKIAAAQPPLAIDRRFQWLEDKAVRW